MINKIKNYAIITLIICALLHLVSCGTRKVNKSDTKEESKTEIVDTSKTEIKTNTNIKVIDCTDTDEITIAPVDNTKEIVVNGKTYKNVSLKHRKVKNNITTNKVEKVAKIEQKGVSVKEESKKSVAIKQTESTKGNFWNWVLLIICITAFLLFVIWSRKYVKKESETI